MTNDDFLKKVIGKDRTYSWEEVVQRMDDVLREELHLKLAPCSNEEFFAAYRERHREKFGEDFFLP